MKLKTQRLKNKIMKRFKGTRSEWIYARDAKGESVFTGRSLICRTHDLPSKKEAKANAILISKAPELLQMLMTIVSVQYDDGSSLAFLNSVISDARDLIKEATEI